MVSSSSNFDMFLSNNNENHIQLMREKILEQNKIILDLTWEIDILREQLCNVEREKFKEEIKKEWI